MGVLTSSTTIPPAVASFFDRKLLMRAVPMLVHAQVGTRRSLKQRNGNTIVFRRFNALGLALAPIVEGIPPTGSQLSKTDVSVTLQQWGDYVTVTDFGKATIESPILDEASEVLSEQAGQTLDALIRDVVAAGTNVFYGGAVASRASLTTTTHKVDTAILDRIIRNLRSNNAKQFREMISAGSKISTFPVRPCYVGITTPDVKFTLETLPGFISVEEYASNDGIMEGEFGAYKDIRFLSSSQAKTFAGGGGTAVGDVKSTSSNADVGTLLVFGREAFGIVPMDGMSLENIIKPLGSAGVGDPLNQLATSGWKHTGARVIFNDNFMARAEVTLGLNNP